MATNWCWAAVGSATDRYYRAPAAGLSQCEVANQYLHSAGCCKDVSSCNKAGQLGDVLKVIEHSNGGGEGIPDPAGVRSEIDEGRPIACRIGWFGQAVGHFVVIYGYAVQADGTLWVAVADPKYEDRSMPYDTLRASYLSAGAWTHTYFTT